jgi:peptide/nickel transport system substrate-binding protein
MKKLRKWQIFTVLIGIIFSIAMLATDASSAAAKAPQRGGVLKIAAFTEAPILNPMMNFSMRVFDFTGPIFSGLVMIDPTQEETSVEKVVPSLAERWTISPDGKIYTFYLRKGVKFHDGQPFTAKDVKYSLEFFANPGKSAGAAMVTMMDRVEIVDDYTVKVSLKYPHHPFLIYLSFPYCVMLPAHLAKVSPTTQEFLIGTGPFKLQKRIPGKVWIYERNPEYFLKGLPYLDSVEVYTMSNWTPALDAFSADRLSMAGSFRYGLEDKESLEKVKKYVPEAVIKLKPVALLRGIQFNVAGLKGRKGPWQDVRVRRAMTLVTDFPGSIMAGQGTPDLGLNSGIVPPHMSTGLSWEEVAKILGIDKPMDQRIKEAKRLMKEAGYPNGFKAELLSRTSSPYTLPVQFIIQSWRENLNIQVDYKLLETPVLFPRRDAGDFDMIYEATQARFGGAPEENLSLFTSDASGNYGKWSNQEYDGLLNNLIKEMDPKKRQEISVKMQRIFLTELPFMVSIIPVAGTAYRPSLHGFVLQTGYTGYSCLDRMWIEK